jgi:hypothetical protein
MGGGGADTGASPKRQDADGPPAGPAISAQEQAAIASVGKVIDEAQKQLRDGDVDPKLLKDLGMTSQQFKGFVEQYTQQLDRIRRNGDDAPAGTQQARAEGPGGKAVQAGQGLDQQVLDVKGGEKLTPDQVKKLYESRSASVSPEYRKQVEDYFRAISEGGAGATPPPASPRTPASGPAR